MQVLKFIKTHLISLLCGLFAVLFIVAGVLGMSSDRVIQDMNAEITRTGAKSISGLKSNPRNEQVIAKEKERKETFETEYRKTVEVAAGINKREPLMPGVFPVVEKAATPYEFKQMYKRTMEVLYSRLDAGTLPTMVEIQEEVQNVEDLKLLEAEQKAEEQEDENPAALARTGMRGRAPVVPGGGGRTLGPPVMPGRMGGRMGGPPGEGYYGGLGMGSRGPGRSPTVSVATGGEPKYDPQYRARVAKAKSIRCYYDENTFHVSPIAYSEEAPTPEDMWFAQVGLWIQEDVAKAIAELNRVAADQVTDDDPCVEDVPVKRLVLVRVLGYEAPDAQGELFFPFTGTPPPNRGASLTGRKSDELYDVVRFVVSVVVDQRAILQVIDHLSRVNFFQCLSADYVAVDHDLAVNEGYFYGTDPVVTATFEFEGYLAREVYKELMPPPIRKLLGIETKDE